MNKQTILTDYKLWFQQKQEKLKYSKVLIELMSTIKKVKRNKQEQLKQYNKKYYNEHKKKRLEKIKQWSKDKKTVCCGKDITNHNYSKHLKSKEHRRWLQNKYKLIHNELLEHFR